MLILGMAPQGWPWESLPCPCLEAVPNCPGMELIDIAFSQFSCCFHAPRMTHLWWHQCHCSPATPAQKHLFCHFSLSFTSVSTMWVQHCLLHGAGVPSRHVPPVHPSWELPACCWDAQSMPSFLQMVSPVQVSVMLPLISTGSSRPAWTEGRSWCFWTQGSQGELLCPASPRAGMLGALFCRRERWKFFSLLGTSLSQNKNGLDGKGPKSPPHSTPLPRARTPTRQVCSKCCPNCPLH